MTRDAIDLFIEQWQQERPDLDTSALGIVARVLMLFKYLEQSADRVLAVSGLTLWQFDVLAALRRSGPPFMLSPSRLMRKLTLTSGAMTNRIDRLEQGGYVQRLEDPDDRRGVQIALTAAGKELIDRAAGPRMADAARNIARLSRSERRLLAALLRKLLLANGGPAYHRASAHRTRTARSRRRARAGIAAAPAESHELPTKPRGD